MSEYNEIPSTILGRVRAICLALPEAYEENAWVGTRWRVRARTFTHVLLIDSGWPPAYARAAATDGPAHVLMFRSAGPELAALRTAGPPFFGPPWRADEVGVFVDGNTDWREIAELIIDSYRALAPRELRKALDQERSGRPTPRR